MTANPRYRRPKERVYRKGHCCWCGRALPPPPSRRTSWCSDRCVREYLSFEPAALRRACWERDGGFCQGCGRDVGALEKALLVRVGRYWTRTNGIHNRPPARLSLRGGLVLRQPVWSSWAWERMTPEERAQATRRGDRWRRLLHRLGVKADHLWEADHKIPVVEGGPNVLANLRTLCLPCHKAETRALASRRAQRRAAERAARVDAAQPQLALTTGEDA